jgi:hypothetical protein
MSSPDSTPAHFDTNPYRAPLQTETARSSTAVPGSVSYAAWVGIAALLQIGVTGLNLTVREANVFQIRTQFYGITQLILTVIAIVAVTLYWLARTPIRPTALWAQIFNFTQWASFVLAVHLLPEIDFLGLSVHWSRPDGIVFLTVFTAMAAILALMTLVTWSRSKSRQLS